MRASQPVDGLFVHVYQWLVKGILHTTSTTNNTMCDGDHSKTKENSKLIATEKQFPLTFYEKGQCFANSMQ